MGLPFAVIKRLNAVFLLWGLATLLGEVLQGCGTKLNDGYTGCAATLVAEGSRLWNRGSQKESHWWRNEAPKMSGVMSRAGGEALVGRLESPCTTAALSVPSSDLSYGLYISPNDVTVLCSEGLSDFCSLNPVVRKKCPLFQVTTETLSLHPIHWYIY